MTEDVKEKSFERFQFQSGTIKRRKELQEAYEAYAGFNSNLVRLKEELINLQDEYYRSFNSNLVRLKVGGGILARKIEDSFNSNLVRLKATKAK